MSRLPQPLMTDSKVNFVLCSVLAVLFGAAFWYSLTSTLDQQQRQHCEQGWQRACDSLK